jgi:hypothetical protein
MASCHHRRFGPTARLFVTCVVVFNMAMVLLSEYMLIGALFRDFVGSYTYPMITTTAVLSLVHPPPDLPPLFSRHALNIALRSPRAFPPQAMRSAPA